MSFFDSIKENFSDLFIDAPSYRAVLFGDDAIYLENVRAIVGYSSEEVKLSLKKGGLAIKGENLYLKKYCDGDLAVCGKIASIERI